MFYIFLQKMINVKKPASKDISVRAKAMISIPCSSHLGDGSSLRPIKIVSGQSEPRHAHQSFLRLWQTGRGVCAAVLMIAVAVAQKTPASAEVTLEKAITIYRAGDYNEARIQLEKLVKTEPGNAAVCYYLGLSVQRAGGKDNLVQASAWLDKAVALDPKNQPYLVDAAGVTLERAEAQKSISMAKQGRDLMIQAMKMDPNYVNAREGLMKFYAQAPWPLGDAGNAESMAKAIATLDPKRGVLAYVVLGEIFEKKGNKSNAKAAYAAALKLDPSSTAAASALNRFNKS
jgi:Flp pilus assembly protein TadD